MAYVEVDVDLGDLETYELVNELVKRLKSCRDTKKLKEEEKKQLREDILPISRQLSITPVELPEIKTLDDKLKAEIITNAWNKYSVAEFESRLK